MHFTSKISIGIDFLYTNILTNNQETTA